MKEHLKRLYAAGRLSEAGIANAVRLGWITQEEANAILQSA